MLKMEGRGTFKQSSDVSIARMTEHDLLEVVELEEASGLSRWGWDAYHAELGQESGVLMFVATRMRSDSTATGARLCGFIASRLVGDELHVNNVAIRDEFRRLGIGATLLERVLMEARGAGANTAFLELRTSNEAARALYTRCGFAVAGQRRNYYTDPLEDALLMRRRI
jgi:ribosomal-protein-alanine N-acetyltransferase